MHMKHTSRLLITAFGLIILLAPLAADAAVEVYRTQSKRDFLSKVYVDQRTNGGISDNTAAHGYPQYQVNQASPTGNRICYLYDPTSYITWWSLGGFDSPGNNSMAAWNPTTGKWYVGSANSFGNKRYNYIACSSDAAPDTSLTASKANITRGESFTLTWRSQYGQIRKGTCTAENFALSGSPFGGSITVSPAQTTTYTYTCTNANGSSSASVTVSVASTLRGSCTAAPSPAGPGAAVTWTATASGGAPTGGSGGGGSSGTWQPYLSEVADFSCPLSPTKLKNYRQSVPDCNPVNPTGMPCSTSGALCKYSYASGCNINTEMYRCEGGSTGSSGTGSVSSCAPQEISNYNPTCNKNFEQIDFSCPAGHRVELTEIACLPGTQGSNSNPFKQRATCVPCSVGTTPTTPGAAGYTYSWRGTDGLSGTTASVQKAYPSAGTKSATVTITSGGESIEVDCNVNIDSSIGGGTGSETGTPGGPGSPGVVPSDPTAPSVRLTADDTDIKEGESTTLRWEAKNVASCAAENFTPGNILSNLLEGLSITPDRTMTYTLDCKNDADRHAYDSVTVKVDTTPTLTITANPLFVRPGGRSMITWSGGRSERCTVLGPGLVAHTIAGSYELTGIKSQGTYTLSCTKLGMGYQKSVTVKILPSYREQ